MSEDQPVRFYAVVHGSYDDYCEFYILATSPENALRQYLKSERPFYTVVGSVWIADLDNNGIIHKIDMVFEMEIPGKHGYLWAKTGNPDIDGIDEKYGVIRCLLCGCGPNENENRENFLNENGKCEDCAKFKIFKP